MSEPATIAIGICEICGAIDHHLVEGACPVCQQKCHTRYCANGATFPHPMSGDPVTSFACMDVIWAEDANRTPGVYACDEGDEL